MPNTVGADIGCGMMLVKLKQKKLEFQKLDTVIRDNIPSGSRIRKKPHRLGAEFPYEELLCAEHINVSLIPEVENVCQDMDIRWEAFRCSGNGGQHLQKNETGVRLIHIPTGITVTSTTQRSQYQNKQEALRKLNAILIDQKHKTWQNRLILPGESIHRLSEAILFELMSEWNLKENNQLQNNTGAPLWGSLFIAFS